MDRYYACSLNKNIVQCVPLSVDNVLRVHPDLLYKIDYSSPPMLDIFILMRMFGRPVQVVRERHP